MEHKVTCTEEGCHKDTPMTTEAMSKISCDCGHTMDQHEMGSEHMQCGSCGGHDKCGNCDCGHSVTKHTME